MSSKLDHFHLQILILKVNINNVFQGFSGSKTCWRLFAISCNLVCSEPLTIMEQRCKTCEKVFPTPRLLKIHIRSRSGKKPFPCTLCVKTFTTDGHLKRHQLSHSIERAFTCPTCGKSFSQSSNLKTHEHHHTGENTFTCTTCEQSFSQAGTLKRHQLRHSGVDLNNIIGL